MSVCNENRCKQRIGSGWICPLANICMGRGTTPKSVGPILARAWGGQRSPEGQFGPQELLGQGDRCETIAATRLLQQPAGRRGAEALSCLHPLPANTTVAAESPQDGAGAGAAMGQYRVLPCLSCHRHAGAGGGSRASGWRRGAGAQVPQLALL